MAKPTKKPQSFIDKVLHPNHSEQADREEQVEGTEQEDPTEHMELAEQDEEDLPVETRSEPQDPTAHKKFDKFQKGN